jgi:hypothetical protein
MPYFNYHGRNKKLIKEGKLCDYFYRENENKKVLILTFKDGRQFPVKEERWMEYENIIHQYYERGIENEKNS